MLSPLKTVEIEGVEFVIRRIDLTPHIQRLSEKLQHHALVSEVYAPHSIERLPQKESDLYHVESCIIDCLYEAVVSPKMTIGRGGGPHISPLVSRLLVEVIKFSDAD